MRIRWTPAATADLQHISDYLKEHHPRYRPPTMRKLYEADRALKQWPQRGRIGREEGTRELLFSPLPHLLPLDRSCERDSHKMSYSHQK